MSELDDRQNVILQAWDHNELVIGHNGGEFGIQQAMANAVSSKFVSQTLFDAAFCEDGYCGNVCAETIEQAVRRVARELAAAHMGYPYLSDCEEATKEKAGE